MTTPDPRGSEKTDWEVDSASSSAGMPNMSPKPRRSTMSRLLRHPRRLRTGFQIEHSGQWTRASRPTISAPPDPGSSPPTRWPTSRTRHVADGQRQDHAERLDPDHGLWRGLLISYLSRFMSLHPGDIISPARRRRRHGQKPPVYLKAGDVVELGINGLGSQRQTARIDS